MRLPWPIFAQIIRTPATAMPYVENVIVVFDTLDILGGRRCKSFGNRGLPGYHAYHA